MVDKNDVCDALRNRRKDLHVVVREDGVYIIGPQNSRGHTRKLDLTTGKTLAFQGQHKEILINNGCNLTGGGFLWEIEPCCC